MIDENPLLAPLGKMPENVGQQSPTDVVLARMHRSLASVVLAFARFVGLFEFHSAVTVTTAGVTIRHNLGRRPWGAPICRLSTHATIVRDREQWTDTQITMQASAGSPVVAFVLF